jgi:dihydropteroate synthase
MTTRWAGLALSPPRVMGILNVTPDSFSDGGAALLPADAIAAGLAMAADGADIIDVGGESTRPDAEPVDPALEQERVLPVIEALAGRGLLVSIDTRNARTMSAAVQAGATIINDVSGLAHDPDSLAVAAALGCPVVLMHMRGTPATMNRLADYQDVVREVGAELRQRAEAALRAGIAPGLIALDPGIGFAKLAPHSLAVLRGLPALAALGFPLLVGVSRKRFIGHLSGETEPARRLGGSLAAGLFALSRGASILRAHDVRETVQAIRVWHTLFEQGTVSLPRPGGAG